MAGWVDGSRGGKGRDEWIISILDELNVDGWQEGSLDGWVGGNQIPRFFSCVRSARTQPKL